MLYLRIIFTILSALCLAAIVPLGILLDLKWVGYCLVGAALFFVLMMLCKQKQELAALKNSTEEQAPADFFSTPNTENLQQTENETETNEK